MVQAGSSITVPDSYNFKNFGTYGVQPFDVQYTYRRSLEFGLRLRF